MEKITQNDKDLLFEDLCFRLPYGVKYTFDDGGENCVITLSSIDGIVKYSIVDDCTLRPFLRPLSSLTEEEEDDLALLGYDVYSEDFNFMNIYTAFNIIRWLCKHHVDFRGLIEKGLAIAVTEENNPYK